MRVYQCNDACNTFAFSLWHLRMSSACVHVCRITAGIPFARRHAVSEFYQVKLGTSVEKVLSESWRKLIHTLQNTGNTQVEKQYYTLSVYQLLLSTKPHASNRTNVFVSPTLEVGYNSVGVPHECSIIEGEVADWTPSRERNSQRQQNKG